MQPNLRTIRARLGAFYKGATPPLNTDMLWLDTTTNVMKINVSGIWVQIPTLTSSSVLNGTQYNVPHFDADERLVTDNTLQLFEGRFSINYDDKAEVTDTLAVKGAGGNPASVSVKSESGAATIKLDAATGQLSTIAFIEGGDTKFSIKSFNDAFSVNVAGVINPAISVNNLGEVSLGNLATGADVGLVAYDGNGTLIKSNIVGRASNTVTRISPPDNLTRGVWINASTLYPVVSDMDLGLINRTWRNLYMSPIASIEQPKLQGNFTIKLGNIRDDGASRLSDAMIVKGALDYVNTRYFSIFNASDNRLFSIAAGGIIEALSYGTRSITGVEASFPVFQTDGKLIESQLITTDGSEITFVNGTRKIRILDGAIEFERLNGGGYPNYIRANRTNGNFLEINARSRVDITTDTSSIQARFNESQNGIAHQFPFYGQGNLQSGTDTYITAFSSTGVIKESSAIKLLGNSSAFTIGHNIPYNSQAYYTALGHSALVNSTNAANFLTIVGAFAGSIVTGALFRQSTILGNAAVFETANNVSNSVIIGEQAAQRAGYIGSVVIGYRAGYFATGDRPFTNVIAIGDRVVPEKDNQTIIGKTSTTEFKTYGAIVNPSYGTGSITGASATFPAFDSTGKLIETSLITTDATDITIGDTSSAYFKTEALIGAILGKGSSQLINDNNLTFRVGINELFRINTNGNVGISTNLPTETLDVNGTGRLRAYGANNQSSTTFQTVSVYENDGTLKEATIDALLLKVPSYVDEAAAIADGLTTGQSYYNTTTKSYSRV